MILELVLLVVLVVFAVLSAGLMRRSGPLAHWIVAWAAAGLASSLALLGSAWPNLQIAAHPLGTLSAALMVTGSFTLAGRRVPAWLLPAAAVFGISRALLAAEVGTPAGYGLGLACEPLAVAVAARAVWNVGRDAGAGRAERMLGPAMALLALAGAAHLAWITAGRPPPLLAPLWVLVAPFVLGVQIQAAADRLRRRIRRELEQRVAERTAALAASEERHRAISALSTDFAFKVHIDRALHLTRDWFSGALARTLGREPEELDGRGWLDLVEPSERDAAVAAFERSGERTANLEVRLQRRGGGFRWVLLRLARLERDADGTVHILGSGRDVTELKEAEAERERLARHVEQVARLESLGILAGGIAHDFNNLLTVIRGSARLALAELAPDTPARARVERIATAAEHAAALTEEMLAYAGKSETSLGPLDLRALVREMEDLLRASVGAHCAIEFEIDPALPSVCADAKGLRRVLLNLVLNASEALEEKPGRVSVHAARRRVTQAALDAAFGDGALEPGEYVALEIRDEGRGMDAATQRRIFEPFFSTKFSGRGLGMAAVLGIVQAHHGAIEVESAPGAGTCVRVLLPLATRAVAAPEAPAAAAEATGRSVLVVDDDAGVLELAREVLAAAGHRVEVAGGGRAAIDRVRAEPDAFDVVVLDLAMPDLGGEEVFAALLEARPDLAVILVTGYDAQRAAARFDGLVGFLRKPWEPEELVVAVARAVGPPTAAARPD